LIKLKTRDDQRELKVEEKQSHQLEETRRNKNKREQSTTKKCNLAINYL